MHVLVTGASRGIGAEMQTQMQARGDHVTGTSRSGATGVQLDVTDAKSLAALPRAVTGPLDLLVCNAGVYLDKHEEMAAGYAPQLWADSFATNVTGVFQTVQALLPALEQSKAPKIAIIASRMGSNAHAKGNGLIYRSSKAAAINLGCNFAKELAPRNIAVGVYHPGWVQTDMGGAEADIDAATSAAGLIACFDRLSLENTGCFENYDGTALPY